MATLARGLRQRLGATSMFMLSGLVGTLCGFGGGAPALAQNLPPLPPQVAFISNGVFTGTIQTQGMTLPITGTLAYLTGDTQYLKLQVSFDTGGQPITRNSWAKSTPTVITEWDIVSTEPTACREEVFSGPSYPQCTAWSRNPATGLYISDCTVTVQPKMATFDFSVKLTNDNKLAELTEKTTIGGMTDSLTITMTSQGTTPPVPSDFNPPSSCSTPDNHGNDHSQGNDAGHGRGTIPLQVLLWLL
jgi:hypothetical protein